MAEITLEKVLADARTLPPNEQEALVDALLMPVLRPRKTIEQLAAEQGKKPVNFDELLKLGEFFPEEESVDDLVNKVQEWRSERYARSTD
jgi:hypothetical protein